MFLLFIPKDFTPSDKEQLESFGKSLKENDSLRPELWKTIITIQATVLAISVGLKQYSVDSPNMVLILAWAIEILTIIIGLILTHNRIEILTRSNINSYKYHLDLREANRKTPQGHYVYNDEERTGMILASSMYCFPKEAFKSYNERAFQLAAKYKDSLPSAEYFKEVKLHKIIDWLINKQNYLALTFYILTILSFIILFISLTLREVWIPLTNSFIGYIRMCH